MMITKVEIAKRSAATRAGADAFIGLLKSVKAKAEADLESYAAAGGNDCADVRDYRSIVKLVASDLTKNVVEASGPHLEGYLRAFADMLCCEVDGCGVADDWDPLESSASAFAAGGLCEEPSTFVKSQPAVKASSTSPIPDNFKFERVAVASEQAKRHTASQPAQDDRPQFEPMKPNFPDSLLCGLLDRAAENLTEEELIGIAGTRDNACASLRHIADVTEGIGCLVGQEGNAGTFRDGSEVATLLFMMSNYARMAQAGMTLADQAEDVLSKRAHDRTNRLVNPMDVYRTSSAVADRRDAQSRSRRAA